MKCIECGTELTGLQQKFCSVKCCTRNSNRKKREAAGKETVEMEPIPKRIPDIVTVNEAARKAGMSYGQYVLQMERMKKNGI